MTSQSPIQIRPANLSDARELAKLIDIAGEGIPHWLWSQSANDTQSPLDVGETRAARTEGGFSYTNAFVAVLDDSVVGMVLSYPITDVPVDDPNDLPAPIAPFVALEAKSVGTWYINALAVQPNFRGNNIGTRLLTKAQNIGLQNGFPRISIQVFEQNTGAMRLYRGQAYEEIARQAVRSHPCQPYYTGDVVLLQKQV